MMASVHYQRLSGSQWSSCLLAIGTQDSCQWCSRGWRSAHYMSDPHRTLLALPWVGCQLQFLTDSAVPCMVSTVESCPANYYNHSGFLFFRSAMITPFVQSVGTSFDCQILFSISFKCAISVLPLPLSSSPEISSSPEACCFADIWLLYAPNLVLYDPSWLQEVYLLPTCLLR